MSPLERLRYIRTLRLPSVPKLTLCMLVSHADTRGKLWIGQRLLAAEVGVTDRSIRQALRWLAAHGLLIQRPQPGRATTFIVTLETFRDAATPELRSAPPRNYVPTEVAPVKARAPKPARTPTPYYSHCIHCGRSVKVAQAHTQGICTSCLHAQRQAPSADVIALFPEANR